MSKLWQAIKETLPTLSVFVLLLAQITRIVYDEHPNQAGYLPIPPFLQWLWDMYVRNSWWLWFVLIALAMVLLVADLVRKAKNKRTSTSPARTLDDVYNLLSRIEDQQPRLPPDTTE